MESVAEEELDWTRDRFFRRGAVQGLFMQSDKNEAGVVCV